MLRKSLIFRAAPARAPGTAATFSAYAEMSNATRGKISEMRRVAGGKDEWVACEKVHGSNFGIYVTTPTPESGEPNFAYSKRSGMLRRDEDFFGYQCLEDEFKKHGKQVRDRLKERFGLSAVAEVLINGELFGGKYDHPEVKPTTQSYSMPGSQAKRKIQAPQKDSFPQYTPHLTFYAFGLKYKVRSDDMWVSVKYDDQTSIFSKVDGMLFAKPLIRGPLDLVVAFDIENFQTTIPSLLQLGSFPLDQNWAEGLVVRHVDHPNTPDDPRIFKLKSTRFQEIRHAGQTFTDSLATDRAAAIDRVGTQLPRDESVFHSRELLDAMQALRNHVVPARLSNVISKIGPDPFRKGEETAQSLAMLVAKDAIKDFLREGAGPDVVNAPINIRREMALRCHFEAQLLVAKEWKSLVQSFALAEAAPPQDATPPTVPTKTAQTVSA